VSIPLSLNDQLQDDRKPVDTGITCSVMLAICDGIDHMRVGALADGRLSFWLTIQAFFITSAMWIFPFLKSPRLPLN
jgi:hypothetical protein